MTARHIPVGETGIVALDISHYRAALAELCWKFHVRRLELFGSAVCGTFHPQRSDLDFLVEFESLSAGEYAAAFLGLKQALENLFVVPVDLVDRSAIRNPYFRQSVESSKALLYAA